MPPHGPQHRYAQAPIPPRGNTLHYVRVKTGINHTYYRATVSKNQRGEVTAFKERKWTNAISAAPARVVSEVLMTLGRNGLWRQSRPTHGTQGLRFALTRTSNNYTYGKAVVATNQFGQVTAYIERKCTKAIRAVPATLVSEVLWTKGRNGHWSSH